MLGSKRKTVGRNFIEAHMLGVFLVLFMTSVFTTVILFYNSRFELSQYVKNTAKIISISAIPALQFNDSAEATSILSYLSADPDFLSGSIVREGKTFASYFREIDHKIDGQSSKWDVLSYDMKLVDQGSYIGDLKLTIDMSRVYSTTFRNLIAIIVAGFIVLVFGFFFTKRAAFQLTIPINQALVVMEKFTRTHDYSIYLPDSVGHPPVEVAALYEQFKEMIREIRKRDQVLSEINQNLEDKVKLRTKELEEAQVKMLEDAHKAGIADVATGVLHNIGNVLNTVNSSSSQISEKLGRSQLIPKLQNLKETFGKDPEELINFLASDNRSQMIGQFFEMLLAAFQEEYLSMSKLCHNIEKSSKIISEIIRDQQSLASNKFLLEPTDIKEVIDRAIEIKSTYLARSKTSVAMNFETLPEVYGHRARLFQVFINLISNSCQAFPTKQADRQILIQQRQDGDKLLLEFHDNGPGISQDRLGDLFSYGFTTKTTGHGFGLHSCKRYMKELNGDIVYQKSKLLDGACFLVSVPLYKRREIL